MKYEAIRQRLDTGDIVLFGGKGGISTGIKWFTGSRWSHVGMVIRHDLGVMLWESTTLIAKNIPDVMTGTVRKGVQLVSLSDRLRTYSGEVCIRLLNVDRQPSINTALAILREELKGRQYETDKLSMISGRLGLDRDEDLSSLFCSELVAEAYQVAGWLPESPSSDSYWPTDFDEGKHVEKSLPPGAQFGDTIFLD